MLKTMSTIFIRHLLNPQSVLNINFVSDNDHPVQAITNRLTHQAFVTAQIVMYDHAKKAFDEKTKLLNIKEEPKHTSNLNGIINTIRTRESNMIQRMDMTFNRKLTCSSMPQTIHPFQPTSLTLSLLERNAIHHIP